MKASPRIWGRFVEPRWLRHEGDRITTGFSWWSVHEFVAAVLNQVNDWPTLGTPAWCSLTHDDPRKWCALLDGAQHWALRMETCQEAKCEASHAISAAQDWSAFARARRALQRVLRREAVAETVGELMTDIDRSDEVRELYALDNPDGAELLDDIEQFLARFVVYPSEHERRAHVLWIAHTWLMDCWDSTPRIAFLSPEPGSGKSRALEVTEPLVPRPVHAVNTSPAYLFRKVSDPDGAPTILYDEIDTVFGPKAKDNEDIRGMLNAGHRKGAVAGRCVVRGKIVETEELPAYCAVALAGLDDLPDTLMSRSVVSRMRRRAPSEPVEPWRYRVNAPEADRLGQRLANWSQQVSEQAVDMWPEMPAGVEDRAADVWEALLAVADLAGDHWPDDARRSAVALVAASMGGGPSLGVMLLQDVRSVFNEHDCDRLVTDQLLRSLNDLEESPWATVKRDGKALDARGLAQRLGRYDIKSRNIRDASGKVLKGYLREDFLDAWSRYLANDLDFKSEDDGVGPSPIGSATSATPLRDPAIRLCGCGNQLMSDTSMTRGYCERCRLDSKGGAA